MTADAPHTLLDASQLAVGDAVPGYDMDLSITRVIQGAAASRDWYEIHHDYDYAAANGADAPFINTPTTLALYQRLLGNWVGSDGWIRLIRFRMAKMNSAGDHITVGGAVTRVDAPAGLVEVEIWIDNDAKGRTVSGTAVVETGVNRT